MSSMEFLSELIQPECNHILAQFEARNVGENLQLLVVATLAATLPAAMNRMPNAPQGAHAYVDTALRVALEGRGFIVTRRVDA